MTGVNPPFITLSNNCLRPDRKTAAGLVSSNGHQDSEGTEEMGLGKLAGAGIITYLLGGGAVMFIVILLLMQAC